MRIWKRLEIGLDFLILWCAGSSITFVALAFVFGLDGITATHPPPDWLYLVIGAFVVFVGLVYTLTGLLYRT